MILSQSDIDRFQSGVNHLGPDDCWEWLRSCDSGGYGRFQLNGTNELSHRVAWILMNGPIPELFEGLPSVVCHSCDNPFCCNPGHLFLGNNKINNQDCAFKGRSAGLQRKGERNPKALKTEIEIKAIKRDLQEGVLTQKEIGLKYDVSQLTVSAISTGKTWSHVNI